MKNEAFDMLVCLIMGFIVGVMLAILIIDPAIYCQ